MANSGMATPNIPPRPRSIFGPIILIAIGVVFLLINAGYITGRQTAIAFAKYWPLILILWGVVKLVEYYSARAKGHPARGIGAGGVVFLVFLIIFGTAFSAAYRGLGHVNWGEVQKEMDIDDDAMGIFFGNKYEFAETLEKDFPAHASLKVSSDRGDVKITPSADSKIHIRVSKRLYANTQAEAEKINAATKPSVSMEGNVVTVESSGSSDFKGGSIDLEISMPEKAAVEMKLRRGDVEIRKRTGDARIETGRGDVTLEELTGNAAVQLRSGDVKASKITGDVTITGRGSDINVAEVSGVLSLQGDFFGDIQLEKLGKGLRFKSTRTDLEIGKLNGSLTLDGQDLRAKDITGPFKMETRSKDVRLEEVTGDVHLENSNGEIEVHSKAPLGNVEITNRNGDIQVVAPSGAGFQVDARTRRGEIDSDFPLTKNDSDSENSATGAVNNGGPTIRIRNEHGNISIRKG